MNPAQRSSYISRRTGRLKLGNKLESRCECGIAPACLPSSTLTDAPFQVFPMGKQRPTPATRQTRRKLRLNQTTAPVSVDCHKLALFEWWWLATLVGAHRNSAGEAFTPMPDAASRGVKRFLPQIYPRFLLFLLTSSLFLRAPGCVFLLTRRLRLLITPGVGPSVVRCPASGNKSRRCLTEPRETHPPVSPCPGQRRVRRASYAEMPRHGRVRRKLATSSESFFKETNHTTSQMIFS